jgi:predicted regulator of Ras-like GTPase activity (Roadblock/LC7/MglB family)
MAFNGNLQEFGIVALLQLPNTNRFTGLLVLSDEEDKAEFYYTNGKLVHAVCGNVEGNQVLASVIDWTKGEFVFQSGKTCETVSITEDLHHSLMWALKDRDERKKREEELKAVEIERKRLETEHTAQMLTKEKSTERKKLSDDLLNTAEHIRYACISDADGVIVAETHAEDEYTRSISSHVSAVSSFVKNYPRGGVGKTFIDDKVFSIALAGYISGYTAILFADPNTRLGILSIELVKFMKKLEGSGFGE